MPAKNYRLSHLNKGAEYHNKFTESPHRALIWRLEKDALMRILQRSSTARFEHLDFACGTGRILSFLSERAKCSVGLDVSESMLSVARRESPRAELIVGDITAADVFGERRFDVITAFRFFPNAEEELRLSVMRRLAELLNPGGIIVFNNHLKQNSAAHMCTRLIGKARRERVEPRDMNRLINKSGLKVSSIKHIGVLPFSEGFMPVPHAIAYKMERVASRCALFRPLAQNWIYVCKKS